MNAQKFGAHRLASFDNTGNNLSGLGLGIASPKSFMSYNEKIQKELSSPGMGQSRDKKTVRGLLEVDDGKDESGSEPEIIMQPFGSKSS